MIKQEGTWTTELILYIVLPQNFKLTLIFYLYGIPLGLIISTGQYANQKDDCPLHVHEVVLLSRTTCTVHVHVLT